jgi:hypothetical protein
MTWSGDREYVEPAAARQMLEGIPVTRIGRLPENTFGRIVGTCMPFKDLGVAIAPASGRSCFVYLAHVEVIYLGHRQQFGERLGWPFVIEDDKHRAIIDPTHARLRIRYERVSVRLGVAGCTKTEVALLKRLQLPDDPIGGIAPHFVFQEARIEPGMRITACGAGVREPDPDADPSGMYRGDPMTRLRIAGSSKNPIAVSNDGELLML